MADDTLSDLETVRGAQRAYSDVQALDYALTVLWHADPSRVGERCRLLSLAGGVGVDVSRKSPGFAHATHGQALPLVDPGISRRPFRIDPAPGGLRLDPLTHAGALVVDGAPLDAPRLVADDELDGGLVISISDRIVLLLHRVPPPTPAEDDRGLLGGSPAIVELRRAIGQVADLPVGVLIRGESGAGKELVARAIHAASARADRPFVAVNMGAIPATVAASELFGHVRGAFTGAVDNKPGVFVRAHGGTLFLDEIGEAPPEIQVALLRALETREIQPVGARDPVLVDVRVVAATDADLEAAVRDGAFRLALLERLSGYQIPVPPLRARRDDIARLMVRFLRDELAAVDDLEAAGRTDRLAPAPPDRAPALPGSIVARFCVFDWPGNVRQLKNLVRQLVISNRHRDRFVWDPVLERVLGPEHPAEAPTPETSSPALPRHVRPKNVDDAQLRAVLESHGWRYNAAARFLGISRTSLFALIDASPTLRRPKDIEAPEIREGLTRFDRDLEALASHFEISKRGLRLRMNELGIE